MIKRMGSGIESGAVAKGKPMGESLGMNDRVKLLKEIMKKRGPVAKGRPVPRGGSYPQRGGAKPTRLPAFTKEPGYKFGPPEGRM